MPAKHDGSTDGDAQRHEDELHSAPILVVDDEAANVRLLEKLLQRAGFTNVVATQDPRAGLARCLERPPDLILLDLHMPELNGIEMMQAIRSSPTVDPPMFLMLTGDTTHEAKAAALGSGATDFLGKPFDNTEALLRIRNLLELRLLHRRMKEQNVSLEHSVRVRTEELEVARQDIIDRLGRAAEFRDDATGQHTKRVGRVSALIARSLGLASGEVERIRRAAPLHDVGKIAIPDRILLKPGPLTKDEFEVMQTHPTVGAQLLAGSESRLMQLASDIALTHHERWDGTGYPRRLAAEEIPLSGRIVALADYFDALTHDRPYRRAHPPEHVIDVIRGEANKHFDPRVTEAFMACAPDATQVIQREKVAGV